MIRVNLLTAGLPARRGLTRLPARTTFAGVLMVLITVTGVGLWCCQLGRDAAALEVEIARQERDLTRLKETSRLIDRVIARRAELSERLALIERLRFAQQRPVNLLVTVSRSMTDGLWLMELNQRGPVIQLDGRARSLTAVTDFVARLQSSGLFDRPVEIVFTSMELVDDAPVVRFAVKAQSAGTKAAAVATTTAPRDARKGD
jgi:Tfp pilus assembly protein PilN